MTPFDTALKADLQTLQHTVEYEGQNFRERDADGNTLLHCAVRSGSLAKVAWGMYLAILKTESRHTKIKRTVVAKKSFAVRLVLIFLINSVSHPPDCFYIVSI